MSVDFFRFVIPSTYSGQLIVLILLFWFGMWCVRMLRQSRVLDEAISTVNLLNTCAERLREYQARLDVARQNGITALAHDHAQYFQSTVESTFIKHNGLVRSQPVVDHLEAIFLAGCDESELDAAELSSATIQALQRPTQGLRLELGLFVLLGLLGTLLGLAETLGAIRAENTPAEELVGSVQHILSGLGNAFAPAIWGVLTSIVGGGIYARFQSRSANRCATILRRATNLRWMTSLYPTVGQKTSQWALQTMQHAIKVTEAARTIQADTEDLSISMAEAKDAGKAFAAGMRGFTRATSNADQVLARVVENLGSEIATFGHSISRWSQFEQQIIRFYEIAEKHQADMVSRQIHLDQTLEAHRELLLDASGKLQGSAESVSRAMDGLPKNFESSVARVHQTAASFEQESVKIMERLAQEIVQQGNAHSQTFTSTLEAHKQHLQGAVYGMQQVTGQLNAASGDVKHASGAFSDGTRHLLDHLTKQVLAQTESLQVAHKTEMTAFEAALSESIQKQDLRLNAITRPVAGLEDRMQALSAPFDNAASKLVEVGTNLLKLNDSSVKDLRATATQVSRVMEDLALLLKEIRAESALARDLATPRREATAGSIKSFDFVTASVSGNGTEG